MEHLWRDGLGGVPSHHPRFSRVHHTIARRRMTARREPDAAIVVLTGVVVVVVGHETSLFRRRRRSLYGQRTSVSLLRRRSHSRRTAREIPVPFQSQNTFLFVVSIVLF